MLALEQVNALTPEAAVARLGHLFEHSPWIVETTWARRPFASRADLHRALVETLRSAPVERQEALIRAHPDLVGRAALAGTLTRASTGEQAAAGIDAGALTKDEIAAFARNNAAYRERFGFPFVICARENRKDAILAGFASRLGNTREQEIQRALREIEKIAWYRLTDVAAGDDVMFEERAMTSESARSAGPVAGLEYEITYGKRRVPVYRVNAAPLSGVAPVPESTFTGRGNVLMACEVDMEVFGDEFVPAYTVGDNSMIVATDSMKNIILKEALAYDGATLEGYLAHVGRQMIERYEQVHDLRLDIRELAFAPVLVPEDDGRFDESRVLFDHRGGSDQSVAWLRMRRSGDGSEVAVVDHECGRIGLRLLKVTGSAFTRFVRDEHTTLPDRGDRPLYIFLDVFWRYRDSADLLDRSHARYVPAEQVRDVVATVFHEFVSESIQHLVHEMGLRLLGRFPQLAEVRFVAQNRTGDPFYQSATDPGVKVYSDPFPAYGEITLRLRRTEGT